MKKLDSSHDKETPQEELKRLRKECKKLASQKDKFKAKYDKAQKELKKNTTCTVEKLSAAESNISPHFPL